MTSEFSTITSQAEVFQSDKEEYELDLTDPEHAKLFLESAENLYTDAKQWDSVARKEGYVHLQMPDVTGEEVFQVMYQIVAELRTAIQTGEHASFTESQIIDLQSLYDDLETIAELIITEYETLPTNLNAQKLKVETGEQTTNIAEKVNSSMKEVVGRLRRSDLSIDVPGEEDVQKLKITTKQKTPPVSAVSADSNRIGQLYSEVREADPVVRTVPMFSPGVMKPAEELKEHSLTGQYLLANEEYRNFIEVNYSSPAAFERLIDMKITQFEAKSIDVFERWLGEEFQSPFVFLQDMSVAEVVALSQSPDVRKIMADNRIKYESFVAWIEFIEQVQAMVEMDSHRPFGELVARWFIESQAAKSQNNTQ